MWIKTKDACFNLNNCTNIEIRKIARGHYDLVLTTLSGDIIYLNQNKNESEIKDIFNIIWACITEDLRFVIIDTEGDKNE
jgi:hypothetical protein